MPWILAYFIRMSVSSLSYHYYFKDNSDSQRRAFTVVCNTLRAILSHSPHFTLHLKNGNLLQSVPPSLCLQIGLGGLYMCFGIHCFLSLYQKTSSYPVEFPFSDNTGEKYFHNTQQNFIKDLFLLLSVSFICRVAPNVHRKCPRIL